MHMMPTLQELGFLSGSWVLTNCRLEDCLKNILTKHQFCNSSEQKITRTLKGIVHPKNYSVVNYSPSCRSKPVRPSFIFRTQIMIFLIKSESFLTLRRQQCRFKAQKDRKDIISFSQLLWLNSQFFFFSKTISSNLWTISFLFTSDCNFLLIWANCKCFGTCANS